MSYNFYVPKDVVCTNCSMGAIVFFANNELAQPNPEEIKFNKMKPNQKMEVIHNKICELFEVEDLKRFDRRRKYKFPRHLFCYVAKKKTGASLKEIGDFLGGRDHTSVIHSINTCKNLIEIKDEIMLGYWNEYSDNVPAHLIPII